MKKGFTLIEMIAAVVILSIIALIVIPIVNKNIRESREKLYNRQIKTIEEAAQRWTTTNSDLFTDGAAYEVSLTTLKEEGHLERGDIKNPQTEEIMNGCVVIEYDNSYNQYTFNYIDTCTNP